MKQALIIQLEDAFDLIRTTDIDACVVDVETNGLDSASSVLSCSAIGCRIDAAARSLALVRAATRYYYPIEPFNARAIQVNGLTEDEISSRRAGASYPRHFRDDRDMRRFIRASALVVAHNAGFDLKFLRLSSRSRAFCTMRASTEVVRLARRGGGLKYPTLSEAAGHFGARLPCARPHQSLCDACLASLIFAKLLDCRAAAAFKPCEASHAI